VLLAAGVALLPWSPGAGAQGSSASPPVGPASFEASTNLEYTGSINVGAPAWNGEYQLLQVAGWSVILQWMAQLTLGSYSWDLPLTLSAYPSWAGQGEGAVLAWNQASAPSQPSFVYEDGVAVSLQVLFVNQATGETLEGPGNTVNAILSTVTKKAAGALAPDFQSQIFTPALGAGQEASSEEPNCYNLGAVVSALLGGLSLPAGVPAIVLTALSAAGYLTSSGLMLCTHVVLHGSALTGQVVGDSSFAPNQTVTLNGPGSISQPLAFTPHSPAGATLELGQLGYQPTFDQELQLSIWVLNQTLAVLKTVTVAQGVPLAGGSWSPSTATLPLTFSLGAVAEVSGPGGIPSTLAFPNLPGDLTIPAPGGAPVSVTFDASRSTGAGQLQYGWRVVDASGNPVLDTASPTVDLPLNPGTYQATLTVMNESGTSSATVQFAVAAAPAAPGTLQYGYTGLPPGLDPVFRIQGPGLDETALGGGSLDWAPPGTYTITASPVTGPDGSVWRPSPASQTIQVQSGQTATVQFSYGAATATLSVDVEGLPGAAASGPPVTVQGPGGYDRQLSGSADLAGLQPGTYTVQASGVTVGGVQYVPALSGPSGGMLSLGLGSASLQFALSAGDQAQVTVQYQAPALRVGSLDVTISGLPSGVSPAVTVTQQDQGYSRALTDSETVLTGLDPGTYTITAQPVSAGGNTYTPIPASQTAVVLGGATTAASVAYTTATGSLTVQVQGLPSGVSGSVLVAGPGGTQSLGSTQTLQGLLAGTYVVTAGQVLAGGVPYVATVAGSPATVPAGGSASVTVQYAPLALQLTAVPASVPADGSTASLLTATVRDPSGQPLSGVTVTFRSDAGVLQAGTVLATAGATLAASTDSHGQAQMQLTASQPGSAHVQASATVAGAPASATVQVTFTSTVPTGVPAQVRLTAQPTQVPADGTSAATLQATVTDATGAPVAGASVNFSTTLGLIGGELAGGQATVTTDAQGHAQAQLTSAVPGTAQVTAAAEGAAGATDTAQVTFVSVAPAGSTLSLRVQPSQVQADGTTQAQVVATLRDLQGNPLPGVGVQFSLTSGSVGRLSAAQATTDTSGQAAVAVVSQTVGTATIQAQAPGIATPAQVQVSFVAVPGATLTLQTSPPQAPADGRTAVTVTADLTDLLGNPLAGQPVSFQTTLGQLSASSATTDASGLATVQLTSAQPGQATVTATADGQSSRSTVQFTPAAPTSGPCAQSGGLPVVTGVSPSSGDPAGGTQVTITGCGFTGATRVDFGPAEASSFKVTSDGQITATSPPGAEGLPVDVTVTTAAGTSAATPADQFTYSSACSQTTPFCGQAVSAGPPPSAAPHIAAIQPAQGPAAGGNTVVLTGSGFLGTSEVDFGTYTSAGFQVNNAAQFTVNSDSQITAYAPPGTGTVTVVVRQTPPPGSNTGAVSNGVSYTYLPPTAPSVQGLSPSSGTDAGGTQVTIRGSGLSSAGEVVFGCYALAPGPGVPGGSCEPNLAPFHIVSDSEIVATAPPSPCGICAVNVQVVTPGGTGQGPQFSYTAPPQPQVAAVIPAEGVAAGGTLVTILGSGFTGATAVQFGQGYDAQLGVNVPNDSPQIQVISDTEIQAVAPPVPVGVDTNGAVGAVDSQPVTVQTPGGTSILAPGGQNTFTWVVCPAPTSITQPVTTSVSPDRGSTGGGTQVTITGESFPPGATVYFGSTPAASSQVLSGTQAVATAPPGSGTVQVRVGASGMACAADYHYLPPVVAQVTPAQGPAGTPVQIQGQNLSGVQAVFFGSVPAASFQVVSPELVTAVAPAGSGTVDVTVRAGPATSAPGPQDHFTYPALPAAPYFWAPPGDGYRFDPVLGVLDFGARVQGAGSPGVAVGFGNRGGSPLTVNGFAVQGPDAADFQVQGSPFCGTLAPGASGLCWTIVFTPGGPGPRSAQLVVQDTAPGSPHVLNLQGAGLPPSSVGSGQVLTWGAGQDGTLGNGTKATYDVHGGLSPDADLPGPALGLQDAAQVAAGGGFVLALAGDGTVRAWGLDNAGQLGPAGGQENCGPGGQNPAFACSTTPVAVGGLPAVAQVAAGSGHALALGQDGSVWAWGDDSYQQLGPAGGGQACVEAAAAQPCSRTPVAVPLPSGVRATAVAAGAGTSAALGADGRVWTWGAVGADGRPTVAPAVGCQVGCTASPVQLSGLPAAAAVSLGTIGSVPLVAALDQSGGVWVAGSWAVGQSFGPVRLPLPTAAISLPAGADLAVTSDGALWYWQISGSGAGCAASLPLGGSLVLCLNEVPGLSGVRQASGGVGYLLAEDGQGNLWAWESGACLNCHGELGDGSFGYSGPKLGCCEMAAPVQVALPAGVGARSLAAGAYFAAVVAGPGGGTQLSLGGGPVYAGDGANWTAHVTDAQGNPVAGATVLWTASGGNLSAASSLTDAFGLASVTLSSAQPGSITLTATLAGAPPGSGITAEVDFLSPPAGGALAGRVTDAAGHGLPGVTVTAFLQGPPGTIASVATAVDGTFVLPGLAPGAYQLQFTDDTYGGHAPGWYGAGGYVASAAAAATVQLQAGQQLGGLDVALPAGYTIRGRITPQGGPGFAGSQGLATDLVVMACLQDGGACLAADRVATDGSYAVRGLAPGSYVVHAFVTDPSSGYVGVYYAAGAPYALSPSTATAVRVAQGDVSGIDLQLPLGHHLSGTVRDDTGSPVAGATVVVCPAGGAPCLSSSSSASTGSDGSYSTGALAPGSYVVSACAPPPGGPCAYYAASGSVLDPSRATPVALDGTDLTGIDLVLPRTYRVSGQVRSAAGVPIAGITVTLCQVQPTGGGCLPAPGVASVVSDVYGSFALSGVLPGSYLLRFEDDSPQPTYAAGYYGPGGFALEPGQATAVQVRGGDVGGLEAVLPVGHSLRGRLAGGLAGAASVQLQACTPDGTACFFGEPAPDGSFAVGPLADGAYVLSVTAYTYGGPLPPLYWSPAGPVADPAAAGTVTVQGQDVSGLSLPLPGQVPVVTGLQPAAGPPAGGSSVTLTGFNLSGVTQVRFGQQAGTIATRSDTALVVLPPAGSGTVTVHADTAQGPALAVHQLTFTYEVPQPAAAELTAEPAALPADGLTAATVVAAVYDPYGLPVPDVPVSFATTLGTLSSAEGVTGPDGTARVALTALVAGSATVSATVYGLAAPVSATVTFLTPGAPGLPTPQVLSVVPSAGPAGGGTLVTVRGSGFTGATAVRFGTAPAVRVQVQDDGTLTAVAPPGQGVVDVTVTGPGGTSTATPRDRFAYVPSGGGGLSLAAPPEAPVGMAVPVVMILTGSTGQAQPGVALALTASGGTLSASSANTDANGRALVLLTSGQPGVATVVAAAPGGLQASTSVRFVAPQPAPPVTAEVYGPGGQAGVPPLPQDQVLPVRVAGSLVAGSLQAGGLNLSLTLAAPDAQTAGSVAASVYATVYADTRALEVLRQADVVQLVSPAGLPPRSAAFVGPLVDFATSGVAQQLFGNDLQEQTNPEIQVTLPYNPAAVPPGAAPQVFWLDTSVTPPRWTNAGVTLLSVGANSVTALLPHLSLYTVVAVSVPVPTSATVAVSPSSVPADGSSAASVAVTVLDQNGQPLAGVPVAFAATLGSLTPAQAVTDGQGTATALLRSGQPGSSTVTAVVAGIANSATATVTFTPVAAAAPAVARLLLQLGVPSAPAGAPVSVVATALDGSGRPVSGAAVSFQAVDGQISPSSAVTDSSGHVAASFVGSAPGSATITAASGQATASAMLAVLAPAGPASLTLVAEPATAPADGTSTVLLRATALDASGQPVPGVVVTLTTTLGQVRPVSVATGADGSASAVLTSGAPGLARITATAPAGLTATTTATFLPVSPQVGPVPTPVQAQPGVTAVPGVGPAGGLLSTPDGTFSATVPAGVVPPGAQLQVTTLATPAGLPMPGRALGPALLVTGPALSTPLVATIRFDPATLEGADPARVAVYARQEDGSWRALPTAVQAQAGSARVYLRGPAELVVMLITQTFQDVAPESWAASAVARVLAEGVIVGYPDGSFRPDPPVTRAEFLKMLLLALGRYPAAVAPLPFADVPPDAWYAPYVAEGVRAGWVQGVGPSAFAPDNAVTRQEAAVLLARALGLEGTGSFPFRDMGDAAGWAQSSLEAVAGAGLVHGFPDGSLRPTAALSRAQAAAILARVLDRVAPAG
jgi:protocatechuate 3,4-dioxygenase beta subunit